MKMNLPHAIVEYDCMINTMTMPLSSLPRQHIPDLPGSRPRLEPGSGQVGPRFGSDNSREGWLKRLSVGLLTLGSVMMGSSITRDLMQPVPSVETVQTSLISQTARQETFRVGASTSLVAVTKDGHRVHGTFALAWDTPLTSTSDADRDAQLQKLVGELDPLFRQSHWQENLGANARYIVVSHQLQLFRNTISPLLQEKFDQLALVSSAGLLELSPDVMLKGFGLRDDSLKTDLEKSGIQVNRMFFQNLRLESRAGKIIPLSPLTVIWESGASYLESPSGLIIPLTTG